VAIATQVTDLLIIRSFLDRFCFSATSAIVCLGSYFTGLSINMACHMLVFAGHLRMQNCDKVHNRTESCNRACFAAGEVQIKWRNVRYPVAAAGHAGVCGCRAGAAGPGADHQFDI
jgi:hypothetical protein